MMVVYYQPKRLSMDQIHNIVEKYQLDMILKTIVIPSQIGHLIYLLYMKIELTLLFIVKIDYIQYHFIITMMFSFLNKNILKERCLAMMAHQQNHLPMLIVMNFQVGHHLFHWLQAINLILRSSKK